MADDNLEHNMPDDNLSITLSREQLIATRYFIEGVKQREIAKELGIDQSRVSRIITQFKQNEASKNSIIRLWEKDYSLEARRLASQLLDKVDPNDHPKSKLVVDSAILVDKARTIDGEASHVIDVRSLNVDLGTIMADLEAVNRRLGLDQPDDEEKPIDITPESDE